MSELDLIDGGSRPQRRRAGAIVAAVLASACGGGGQQLPRAQASEPGAALFNGYTRDGIDCYRCHGGDGGGTKWGPALATRVPQLDDAALRRVIVDGKQKMPAFRGKLDDRELAQLVGWLRARFDRERGPAPALPPAAESAADPCATDADCIVTNFPGCCACPQCSVGPPLARSRDADQMAVAACAAASCDFNMCNVGGMCPPGEPADHFTPRCRAGRCVAVRR